MSISLIVVKMDFEKPTIGILLCQEKNDALVKLTLQRMQIFMQRNMRYIFRIKAYYKEN